MSEKRKRPTRYIYRRRITQIKYVHEHDPALADECFEPDEDGKTPYQRYEESDYTDFGLLKIDGEAAVIYMKQLSVRQTEICYSIDGVARNNTIARCVIEKIEGVPVDAPLKFCKEGAKGTVIAPEWWYDYNPFPTDIVSDIAAVAFNISEARAPLPGR